MLGLKGKTVFISGASSGIGKASAEAFAMAGARLILCARNIDKITALAEKLKEHFETESLIIKLDVRNRSAVEEAIDKLPEDWKKIDILVNNAGGALGLEKLHEGDPVALPAFFCHEAGQLFVVNFVGQHHLGIAAHGHQVGHQGDDRVDFLDEISISALSKHGNSSTFFPDCWNWEKYRRIQRLCQFNRFDTAISPLYTEENVLPKGS